jgi:hypothetical protein
LSILNDGGKCVAIVYEPRLRVARFFHSYQRGVIYSCENKFKGRLLNSVVHFVFCEDRRKRIEDARLVDDRKISKMAD